MQTKAILFDLDGVILDSEKEYRRFWLQAAQELGLPLKEDVVLQLRSCDSSITSFFSSEAATPRSPVRSLMKPQTKRALMTGSGHGAKY